MQNNDLGQPGGRRDFLGTVATGAAAVGLSALFAPFAATAEKSFKEQADDADTWFSKIKGKHRIVFDVTRPNGSFPFAWPRVFLMTNQATGTPEKESNVVVILRHDGIPYAFEDRVWAKYKFGEVFKANDPLTKAPATRNPFWQPKPGDFKVPGIGNVDIGINQLQDSGVMFCVCDVALTVSSNLVAQELKQDAAEVKKDWLSGLLPSIQVVPSGVWAVGRAQEHGCAYCYAG
jgi:intracellular sulfur oxidation DsrE/DsrF family protein